MKIVVAKKEHRCDTCGHRIPVGARYWSDYKEPAPVDVGSNGKEHTNCLDFEREPVLPQGFNQDRRCKGIAVIPSK